MVKNVILYFILLARSVIFTVIYTRFAAAWLIFLWQKVRLMKSALSTGMRSMPYVANRRMGLRWLKYGEGLRGLRRFPLFADVSLDDIPEFAPYMFTLALSTKPDGLTLQFVGKELESDCGGDVTNKELSNLPPQSLLARAIQQHSKVIADRGPVTVSDNFSNMQGHEIRYRAVMLPFSSAGNEIDYIIGVITWTAIMSGAAPDESDEGANAGSTATTEDAQQSVPPLIAAIQEAGTGTGTFPDRREVSDLTVDAPKPVPEAGSLAHAWHVTEPSRNSANHRGPSAGRKGHVIVLGSAKGGTGKSTIAMHLIVSLLCKGNKVGSIDLDSPQSTLSRYIENRRALNLQRKLDLPIPDHLTISDLTSLEVDTHRLADTCDYVVIDTSGSDSASSRMVHAWADTLITPINDSFVDLDVLAVVDTETQEFLRQGHYAKMVLEARKQKASRTAGVIDWIVLRNRLSNLQARNKRCMADTLEKLSTDLDFRNGPGLSDRVVYRELFQSGLTLLDLREDGAGVAFSMSHVAARQELRALVAAIKPLPAAQADFADQESRWPQKLMQGVDASEELGGRLIPFAPLPPFSATSGALQNSRPLRRGRAALPALSGDQGKGLRTRAPVRGHELGKLSCTTPTDRAR